MYNKSSRSLQFRLSLFKGLEEKRRQEWFKKTAVKKLHAPLKEDHYHVIS